MLGSLFTKASAFASAALLLEIAVLVLLLIGYWLARHGKPGRHGYVMAAAVGLHTLAIASVMGPSLVANLRLMSNLLDPGVLITWTHVILGIVADGLGLFLVGSWRFRQSALVNCTRRRPLMRPLIILWILSLVLGISFYVYYYL